MKTAKQYLKELAKEASYLGEDCEMMTVACKTKIGAWRKFRQLVRGDAGELEAEEIKLEDVGIGWFRLPTIKDKEEYGEDTEWFVSFKEESPHQVWVYSYC